MIRRALLGVSAAAAMAVLGCQQSPPPIVEVEGRVTLDGKPLPKAEVCFYPLHPGLSGEYIAVGETDDDGRFVLRCKEQRGACACENSITVAEAPMPDELRGMSGEAQRKQGLYRAALKNRPIPEKYSNLAQSPLKQTVSKDRKEYNLELSR